MLYKTWTTRDRAWKSDPTKENCDRCATLNGTAIQAGDAFRASDGTQLYEPPLHRNCDCRLVYSNEPPRAN
jgi:hypothetical protein